MTDEHSENCKAIRCHFDGARPVLVSPSVAMDSTNTDARCPSCDQLRARVAELQAKWDAQGVKDGETFMETRKLVSRVAELERDLTSAIQVRDQAWADKKAAKEARFKAERERDEARAEVASLKAKYALDTAFLRTLAKKAYTDTQVTVEAATLRAERA
ncbi:MAG TPA: CxxxxCH/CxxCH domain-containing protein, partial [Gemmatimonadales bacterium]|nr:CxxxxCH/CxxCH domain-containing protein [Gemmatimonadales bacterium]